MLFLSTVNYVENSENDDEFNAKQKNFKPRKKSTTIKNLTRKSVIRPQAIQTPVNPSKASEQSAIQTATAIQMRVATLRAPNQEGSGITTSAIQIPVNPCKAQQQRGVKTRIDMHMPVNPLKKPHQDRRLFQGKCFRENKIFHV